MQIRHSESMDRFFDRCRANLADDRQNLFLGARVTKATEKEVQRKLRRLGVPEFQGPEEAWPSLFISAADFLASPYHAALGTADRSLKGYHYETVPVAAGELFSLEAIQSDPDRELRDWLRLRAIDHPYPAVFLRQGGRTWMLDAPSEAATNDPYARKAHGRVLTFGLGIGYFAFMALRNPAVTSVEVIERSPEVIRMFRECLLPRFPQAKPLAIRQGDAYSFFTADFLKGYDYVYTDIWQSSDDGLPIIGKLLGQACLGTDKADFWIEDSCVEPVRALIFSCFGQIYAGKAPLLAPDYQELYRKASAYFRRDPSVITEPGQLKDRMYDRMTIRRILGNNQA